MRSSFCERLETRCLLSAASDIGLVTLGDSGMPATVMSLHAGSAPTVGALGAVIPDITGNYIGSFYNTTFGLGGQAQLSVHSQYRSAFQATMMTDTGDEFAGKGTVNAKGKMTFTAKGFDIYTGVKYSFTAKGQVSGDWEYIGGTYQATAGRVKSKGTFAVEWDGESGNTAF